MAIKVAVVGLGQRGGEWVRELNAAPAYELVACVDNDPEAFKQLGDKPSLSSDKNFAALKVALETTRCDAAIIATPPDLHVEACERALEHGCAVLVEKPFTLHLEEAVSLVSLAEQKKAPLLVAQNYRYLRSFRTARRLIQDGAIGHVGTVVCNYYVPPHSMAPSLARLQNSVLWGMAVHHLDALRYVLGTEVISVAAESYTLPNGQLPPGASFRAMLTFEGETRVSYSATYESSGHEFFERGQEFYARFVGSRATLHVFQRWLILCETGKLPRLVKRGARKFTEEQILLHQLEKALLNDEPPEVSGRDNLKTMAVVEACLRSAAERTWVNPKDVLNEFN